MTPEVQKPLRIFCSYSHRDEEYLNELRTWLRGLEWQGLIEWWHDREIAPGWEWEEAIDKNLRTAEIIFLLVTPDFMGSKYVYEREIGKAVERHDRGEARVIPIIVRPSDWEWASFGKLQALPKDAKPITRWPDRDEAWFDVEKGIRNTVQELLVERQEQAAKEQYCKAVAEAWADNKVTAAEVERLDALVSELGLSADTAAEIEHEVLDNTKEAILERQERAQRLAAIYEQGLRHIEAEEWQQALQCFQEIQGSRPSYRDTEELLSQVRFELAEQAEQTPPAPAHPQTTEGRVAVSLAKKIQQDMQAAMKERDRGRVGALRMLGAALKNGEIEAGRPLTEEEEQVILRRELKQREESAEAFRRAGREVQAASESAEADIVREYLPEPLSPEELEHKVDEAMQETGATGMKDMGAVMKRAMALTKGRAEGQKLAALVRERLQ